MLPFTFGHGKKDKTSTPKKTVTSQKPPVYSSGTSETKENPSSTTEAK